MQDKILGNWEEKTIKEVTQINLVSMVQLSLKLRSLYR